MTIIGVDAHKRSHTCVAVDSAGVRLAQKTVPATSAGHTEVLRWALTSFGTDLVWGVEDVRPFTALLERELLAADQVVKRVPAHIMARNRGSARTWGKSDPIDALAVARALLAQPDLPAAVHDHISWELKLLVDRREDLVLQRVATVNRLHERLHLLAPERPKVAQLKLDARQVAVADLLAHQPGLTAELARQELADIRYFSDRITALTQQISHRVHELGSSLLSIPGCAELTAAKLIAEAANMDRFHSEAAFARYTGIAPVPVSSGSTTGRVRLSRSGNRACNVAIHRIAVTQVRIDGPGRVYFQRRRSEGDTFGMAMRSLKRRLCRVVYHRLQADYRARPQTDPRPVDTTVDMQPPAWLRLTQLGQSLWHEEDLGEPV